MDFVFDYAALIRIAVILIAGLIGIPLIQRLLTKGFERWYDDPIRIRIVVRVITYIAVFLIGASLLQEMGINITALLGAAGVLGVAIGFAAQASVSNIISGIFVLIEHPFAIGDSIQIDGFDGKVVDINLFSIGLLTPDHRTIRVPHEKLLKNIIVNRTQRTKRRYEVVISLHYKEDLDRAREIFMNAMMNESYCLEKPEPLMWVNTVNGDMVQLTVAVWVASTKIVEAKRHMLGTLYETCKRENIQLYQPGSYAIQVTEKTT